MLLNYVEQSEYAAANGVDTTTPLRNMPEGYARIANNSNLGLVSGWIKRNGYVKVNSSSAWSTRDITNGIEFRKSNGTLETILFGKTSGGTSGILGSVAAGGTSVSDIQGGYSDVVRPAFAQFKGRVFMYNGADDGVLYDGAGTRQIGVTAPTDAPTGSAGGSGDLTAGLYLFAITYYNSTTKAESSPSPISDPITSSGSDAITIDFSAGDSDTATHVRIWRTVANGNQLFFAGEELISAVEHESSISDEELGRPLEMDNSRLVDVSSDKGQYPIVAQGRVFVVTGRNEIRHSALGYDGPMPESFRVNAVVDTTGTYGNSDDIVGLGNVGDLVIVVKRRSVGVLQPLELPLPVSEVDTQFYRYVEISDSVGGVAHWAGAQVQGEYIFLGRDMIWATDGKSVRPIAHPIQSTLRSLGWSATQVTQVSCGVDPKYSRIYFQVFVNNLATDPAITIVGDYQQYPNFRWTFYAPGENAVTHPGIQAGCFINVTNSTDGSKDVWFGNVKSDGRVYKMNTGTNDDGSGIAYTVRSRPLDLGQPNHLKLYKTFRAEAVGDSTDYNLTLIPFWDMSSEEGQAVDVSLSGEGGMWDVDEWDEALWASDASIPTKYHAHRKARFIQMQFEQHEADAPVTVFGWSPSGSLFQN